MLRMAHATHPEDITGLDAEGCNSSCLFPTATHANLFAASFMQHIKPDTGHSARQNTDVLGTGSSYLNSEQAKQANC